MSILIKGMGMPTSDELLVVITPNGEVMFKKSVESTWNDTTAIPVPPHGRLIDADAYEARIRGLSNREYRRENGTICDAIKFLHPHYTPTVIEAEEPIQKNGEQ